MHDRLDKILVHCGWLSRSEARAAITAGRVTVGGEPVREPARKLDPAAESVLLDGSDIDYQEHYWIMMNKPAGVVSSTDDPKSRTVLELLDERHRRLEPFPVGRLDKDAAGLLLLTTDGTAAHKLLSPRSGVEKLYRVETDAEIPQDAAARFRDGIRLSDGTLCRQARLELQNGKTALITVTEGKYHQVKRMLGVLGLGVISLERLAIGAVRLDSGLPRGAWKRIDPPF